MLLKEIGNVLALGEAEATIGAIPVNLHFQAAEWWVSDLAV
jgi:hypothetical protein